MANKKELLTAEKMRGLFGEWYNKIIYYNFDSRQWDGALKDCFNTKELNPERMDEMRTVAEPKFITGPNYMRYEWVALVVTLSKPDGYRRPLFFAHIRPEFDMKGEGLLGVGTVVIRDRWTGEIIRPAYGSVVFSCFFTAKEAKRYAASDFVYVIRVFPQVMRTLGGLFAHVKMKSKVQESMRCADQKQK